MENFVYRLFAIKDQKQSYYPIQNMRIINNQGIGYQEVALVSLSVRSTVEMVCVIVIFLTHILNFRHERVNAIAIAPKVKN
jgi:hypothetical protein